MTVSFPVTGGGGGDGGASFEHDQGAASTTWVITHNLGVRPAAVQVIDSAGTVVYGSIHHDSIAQLTITFSAPFSGKARVSS